MATSLRIGDLARASGLSPDTLRHYERLGLLPVLGRTEGGFRQFPPRALQRVKVIQRALSIGFTLQELAECFRERAAGRPPCRRVLRLAQLKLDALERQIECMLAARAVLHALLNDWDKRLRGSDDLPAHLLDSLADIETQPVRPPFRSNVRRLASRAKDKS